VLKKDRGAILPAGHLLIGLWMSSRSLSSTFIVLILNWARTFNAVKKRYMNNYINNGWDLLKLLKRATVWQTRALNVGERQFSAYSNLITMFDKSDARNY
jgi:hypothetical protein